jgi:ribosomal protein S17
MANNRRRLVGRVVSDKMENRGSRYRAAQAAPVYKKVASTKKVMAHDESNAIPMGALCASSASLSASASTGWPSNCRRRSAVVEMVDVGAELKRNRNGDWS